jgi:hypothetical protein
VRMEEVSRSASSLSFAESDSDTLGVVSVAHMKMGSFQCLVSWRFADRSRVGELTTERNSARSVDAVDELDDLSNRCLTTCGE